MARTGSPSEGRDVGVTFSLPPRTGPTVLPMSGDVGSQYTPGAGWAQAICYRDACGARGWQGAIAVAQGGEGSVAANGFWAALNMATVLDLPAPLFDRGQRIRPVGAAATARRPAATSPPTWPAFPTWRSGRRRRRSRETALLIAEAVAHVRGGRARLLRLRVPRLLGHTSRRRPGLQERGPGGRGVGRDPLPALRPICWPRGT
jgi:2-oxoisovalerate dehydrogenase E1 component